jgi:hypothetical protein
MVNCSLYQQALLRARATVLIQVSTDVGSVGLSANLPGKTAFCREFEHVTESKKFMSMRTSKVFSRKIFERVFR